VSTLSATPSPSPCTSQIAEASVGAPNSTIASQEFLPSPQTTPVSPPMTFPHPVLTGSPQSDCPNPTSSSSINPSAPLVPTHQPAPVSPTTVPFPENMPPPILNNSLDRQCINPPASNSINRTASPTPTPQAAPTFTTTEPDTPNPAACPDTQDAPFAAKWVCPLQPPPTFLSLYDLALPLKLQRKAIRSQQACVQWFKSTGNGSLQAPPEGSSSYDTLLCLADLYVHQDDRRHIFQVWMWSGHKWDPIKPTAIHPTLPGYCLKILDKGEPSWVTRKTMVSDQGRAKRRLFE